MAETTHTTTHRTDSDPDWCVIHTRPVPTPHGTRFAVACGTHDCAAQDETLFESPEEAADDFLCDLGSPVTFAVWQGDDDAELLDPTAFHYALRAAIAERLDMDHVRFHHREPWAAGSMAVAVVTRAPMPWWKRLTSGWTWAPMAWWKRLTSEWTRRPDATLDLAVHYCADLNDQRRVLVYVRAARTHSDAGAFDLADAATAAEIRAATPRAAIAPDDAGVYLRTHVTFDDPVDPNAVGVYSTPPGWAADDDEPTDHTVNQSAILARGRRRTGESAPD